MLKKHLFPRKKGKRITEENIKSIVVGEKYNKQYLGIDTVFTGISKIFYLPLMVSVKVRKECY